MSIYKTCPIEKVLARVYRDFKPSNSGWLDDAAEWIGDAIEIMKVCQNFTPTSTKVKVVDYRAKLPCDIQTFIGVEYKCNRLIPNGGLTFQNKCKCANECCCVYKCPCNSGESYALNPNYIMTSFKEGEITVHYEGLELDCNGLPYVIDDAEYITALVWYIMSMMCLRGFKHQTIDYSFAWKMWETHYPRAQNRFRLPDIESHQRFLKSWMGLVKPTNLGDTFFNGSTYNFKSEDIYPAGTKIETFPLLGDNLNNI